MAEPVQRSFIHIFSTLIDPRVENDNKRHLLIDIVAITVCAVICKCETWDEIAEFGEVREEFFRTFLELPNGIPSHDTFRRVFMLLEPKYLIEPPYYYPHLFAALKIKTAEPFRDLKFWH